MQARDLAAESRRIRFALIIAGNKADRERAEMDCTFLRDRLLVYKQQLLTAMDQTDSQWFSEYCNGEIASVNEIEDCLGRAFLGTW